MDPVSAIVIALIWAALRGPREAGRSVRNDYRNRRDRWNTRAANWSTGRGRGRGGRGVGGYDRDGRPYPRGRAGGRNGGGPAPGWRRDPGAWTGPEGRARVARGIRPSALRTGIVAGALAYTALFGAGVAARGFARGLHGGYRMGKLHYRGKYADRNLDPTVTVATGPEAAGDVLDAEIVDAHEPDAPAPRQALAPPTGTPAPGEPAEQVADQAPQGPAGWLVAVFAPGTSAPVGEITVTDPAALDEHLAVIGRTPGLRAEIRELADLPEDSRPTPAGPTPDPLMKEQTVTDTTTPTPNATPGPVPVVAQYVPVGGAPMIASQLLEGASYDAHRYNLGFLLLQAQREYASGELALACASTTRQRAVADMNAAEQMATALASQDFGTEHVAYMTDLHETLAAQVLAARDAENAARESLANCEQVIEVCVAAEAAFRRDHGQLAEAHAAAPNPAKTREAYQG